MKRGDVWWIKFDPSVGGEIQKERPTVIVSSNVVNKVLNRLQVVPLTSKIDTCYPNEAIVILQGTAQKAMAHQLTTVSKLRVSNYIGHLRKSDMKKIENAIKWQLSLEKDK